MCGFFLKVTLDTYVGYIRLSGSWWTSCLSAVLLLINLAQLH